MTKGPHDVLDALDRADRQADLAKHDPHGRYCTLREVGIMVEPGKGLAWNKTHWIPGAFFDFEKQASAVKADQRAQDKLNLAESSASQDSAHSSGIIQRPIIRRS